MEAWLILIVLFFYMLIQGVITVIVLWKLGEISNEMVTREDLLEIMEESKKKKRDKK